MYFLAVQNHEANDRDTFHYGERRGMAFVQFMVSGRELLGDQELIGISENNELSLERMSKKIEAFSRARVAALELRVAAIERRA